MDPYQQQNQNPESQPQLAPMPTAPEPLQTPNTYGAPPVTEYDPTYLDSIAPPPAPSKFLSGTFGKLFFVLIGIFVLAVSLIIAFAPKDDTADLQQLAVRLDNFGPMTKTVQKSLKSKNLAAINSTFEIWVGGNQTAAEDLLKKGGVQKTEYNKTMVKSEKAYAADLSQKFEDARLSATLNRVYANTMAAETEKLVNMLNSMAKKSKSAQIRDFAKSAGTTITAIQKQFEDFDDNGN
jgi:hypothetical protein